MLTIQSNLKIQDLETLSKTLIKPDIINFGLNKVGGGYTDKIAGYKNSLYVEVFHIVGTPQSCKLKQRLVKHFAPIIYRISFREIILGNIHF